MSELFVVGTPIGNLKDITYRAVETLKGVDFICAEDTRVTAELLSHFDIKKPLVSYHEHSSGQTADSICSRILSGESAAIVTDAGMPCISDPGEDLVRLCAEHGVEVIAIPGCCAVVTALAVSGLPTQRFCFEGFLAVSGRHRAEHLESLKAEQRTMIFYEAPHKLLRTLEDLQSTFGADRHISLCRELTKLHEETLRTTISGAIEHFTAVPPKGEFVLVVRGAEPKAQTATEEDALARVFQLQSEGMRLKDACRQAGEETGFAKNQLYRLALERSES